MRLFSVKYQSPPDEVRAWLKAGLWAVPFWGDRGRGPSGVLFFDSAEVDGVLASEGAALIKDVKAILFNRYASKPQKRRWLAELGLEATREGVNRTMEDACEKWVPLLRQRKKAFGLIRNFPEYFAPNFDPEAKERRFFLVKKTDAHVFGDAFKPQDRHAYAVRLGAAPGQVESLRGKPRAK